MQEYKVMWCIDIYADNPTDAARKALEIMQDKDSTAVVFTVGEQVIDLLEEN